MFIRGIIGIRAMVTRSFRRTPNVGVEMFEPKGSGQLALLASVA
jgi:hypothetical protein